MAFPMTWGEWAALVSIISAAVVGAWWAFRYFHNDIVRRIDTCELSISESVRKLSSIEAWQRDMEDRHLPQTYARRDLVDLQFKEARESNLRVETLMKELRTDLRESMHTLRHDVISLIKRETA